MRAADDINQLSSTVLGLIRTRSDLHRWSAANAHGRQMHEAVELLRTAVDPTGPADLLSIVEKAIASAVTVVLRADDSSGIIGDAIKDLLRLHAQLAPKARPPASKLATWMIKFQFDGKQDFFTLDVVDYLNALGTTGLEQYRAALAEIAGRLGPAPTEEQEQTAFARRRAGQDEWTKLAHDRHDRFLLEYNAQRLAVADRDVDAIITTHVRDRKVAAWLQDTAEALAEIDEFDLAIDWARQGADFDQGHQAQACGQYWCDLLARHRPDEELAARLEVFRRWPNSTTAVELRRAAGPLWPAHRDEVFGTLARSPRDAVVFAQFHLNDLELAWTLAHNVGLTDHHTWAGLVDAYASVDPLAVLDRSADLVRAELSQTDAGAYRHAAKRLRTMRSLANGTDRAAGVDALIASLREEHRRRPRLQREFDTAGLP